MGAAKRNSFRLGKKMGWLKAKELLNRRQVEDLEFFKEMRQRGERRSGRAVNSAIRMLNTYLSRSFAHVL